LKGSRNTQITGNEEYEKSHLPPSQNTLQGGGQFAVGGQECGEMTDNLEGKSFKRGEKEIKESI